MAKKRKVHSAAFKAQVALLDNVFMERLWRSVKYEDVYIWCYETVPELRVGLGR